MVVVSDLIQPRLLLFSFGMFFTIIICPLQSRPAASLFFHVSSLRRGVSRHSKCLSLCRLQSALVFEQVAINNASELNLNEDEAPAIRGGRLH